MTIKNTILNCVVFCPHSHKEYIVGQLDCCFVFIITIIFEPSYWLTCC